MPFTKQKRNISLKGKKYFTKQKEIFDLARRKIKRKCYSKQNYTRERVFVCAVKWSFSIWPKVCPDLESLVCPCQHYSGPALDWPVMHQRLAAKNLLLKTGPPEGSKFWMVVQPDDETLCSLHLCFRIHNLVSNPFL